MCVVQQANHLASFENLEYTNQELEALEQRPTQVVP